MAATEAPPAPNLLAQIRADLMPFPFRAALTWRIALLCALVIGTAMMFGIFEAAISCYLIIYLTKPDAVVNIGTGVGLIVVVSFAVAGMVWLTNVLVASPPTLIFAMAFASFAFLYLGAASQLGEMGGIVGLVVAFVLSIVYMAPLGDAVAMGLRYAWYMVAMPMLWMVAFNTMLGLSPVRLLRGTLLRRLSDAADAIASGAPTRAKGLIERMREDDAAFLQQTAAVKVLNLVSRGASEQIARDVRAGYRLMLAATALPQDLPDARRTALVDAIRSAAAAIEVGHAPALPPPAPEEAPVAAPKAPFFYPDARTNPAYVQFALKTTAAAMICYLIYTGLNWQGIHTAMVTCYVAALGTTGETVHKLGLRIGGCLIGAAMGMGSALFIIPHLDGVGGLMALIFVCLLPAAWVSTGPERIAYGGVQIGLAFLLTVIQGFGPGTSLESDWDRIVGILLGNVVVYLLFTRLWPMPAGRAARTALADALSALGRLAALAPEQRPGAIADAARAVHSAGKAAELLDLLPFEPKEIRPAAAAQARLQALVAAIPQQAGALYLSREPLAEEAARLAALAASLGAGADPQARRRRDPAQCRRRAQRRRGAPRPGAGHHGGDGPGPPGWWRSPSCAGCRPTGRSATPIRR